MEGRIRIAGAFVAVVALLAGCSRVPPSVSSSPIATDDSRIAAIAVGDCIGPVEEDGHAVDELLTVGCEQEHNWEVAAIVPLTASEFPGVAALQQQATTACTRAFSDYVGIEAGYSLYRATFVAPSEAHWANPDARRLVCLVGLADHQRTGSLKGTALAFGEVGDCLNPGASGEMTLVDCSVKHAWEVYAETRVDGKQAPTEAALDKLYTSVCEAGFTRFVGIAAGRSTYEIQHFLVSAELWSAVPDHRLVCSAGTPTGGITATLKGVKK